MKVRIKTSKSLGAAAQAANEAAARAVFAVLAARFQDAIRKPAYQWPRLTVRSNGQVAGSPRTIVDSGLLAQSQQAPRIQGTSAEYRWTTAYAVAVHEGAVLSNGTVLPARPWTRAVLGTEKVEGIEVFDPRETFKAAWVRRFRG